MTLVLNHDMGRKNYHVTEFDSFSILDAIKQQPVAGNSAAIPTEADVQDYYKMGAADIAKLFTEGWQEGADQALQMADELEAVLPMPKDLRRALHFAESGDELEINNLYSGRFDNLFRTRKRKYRPTQTVITIGMHLCTLWVSPSYAMLSGAVGIALARTLEKYGYRVELLSLLTAQGYGSRTGKPVNYVGVVRVKEAFSPLNAAEIAAVHHPATAHTIVKAAMARGAKLAPNCGCNDFASSFATKFMQKTGRRFDYCFDWIGGQGAAKRELTKAVLAIGGTVFEEEGLQKLETTGY